MVKEKGIFFPFMNEIIILMIETIKDVRVDLPWYIFYEPAGIMILG